MKKVNGQNEWKCVSVGLPPEAKFKMSEDVLTIAGDKMSVKCYDYELGRWSGSPHVTVVFWMYLPCMPKKNINTEPKSDC